MCLVRDREGEGKGEYGRGKEWREKEIKKERKKSDDKMAMELTQRGTSVYGEGRL